MSLDAEIVRAVVLLLFMSKSCLCNAKEKDFCLEDDAVIHRILDLSYIQCQEECGKRRHCKAINYRRSFNLCELLGTDQGSYAANVPRKQACIFLKKAEMSDEVIQGCNCPDGETCDPVTKTCAVTECSKIVATNAQLFGNMHSIGSRVKFRCNQGYVDVTNVDVTNVMNAVCEASGQWSYKPNCIRDCGTVPNIPNAHVISGGDTTTEGAVLQYQCLPGYTLNGNSSNLTCTADGIWFDQANVVCSLDNQENNNQGVGIGDGCNNDADCSLTNGVCVNGLCFCSPLYRYSQTINDCVQECTAFTDTFISIPNKFVYGFNEISFFQDVSGPIECENLCRNDPTCLIFEAVKSGSACSRGTVSYLNILDADPGKISSSDTATLYYRDCVPV